VKLNVHEIEEAAKELVYEESTGPLNGLLIHGQVCDFEFPAAAEVRVDYYRAGQELFFQGHISGSVVGHCARCLEEYTFDIDKEFHIVLVPKLPLAEDVELGDDDLDLSFYEGDTVELSPLVLEQIILALPTRPLCRETCKGLCPTCGVNLNAERCDCAAPSSDPRLAVLRNLKVGH
jgi:DUF177 domain-containing protein